MDDAWLEETTGNARPPRKSKRAEGWQPPAQRGYHEAQLDEDVADRRKRTACSERLVARKEGGGKSKTELDLRERELEASTKEANPARLFKMEERGIINTEQLTELLKREMDPEQRAILDSIQNA